MLRAAFVLFCLFGLFILPLRTVAADWEDAAELRKQGSLESAERKLRKYASPVGFDQLPSSEKIDFLRGLLELAHIRALKEDVSGSLALLNWAESRPDTYQRAISCIRYAGILLDLGEFERAKSYLKNADESIAGHATEELTGTAIGQSGEAADTGAAWRELRDESAALKADVESEELKEKFGATYGNYVKLRRLQKVAKQARLPRYQKEAMKIADEIIDTDPASQFAAAAEYLKGELMAARLKEDSPKKEIDEVKKYLDKFVKKQPEGLYRGEALMLLGKISLEIEWDAKDAEKYYTQALDYFRKAREKRDALSLYAPVSEDLKQQTEATQKPTTLNQWKRIVYHDEDPLKLYNTASAPAWYISDKEKECLILSGFVQYATEKYDDAAVLWKKAGELDAELTALDAAGVPNELNRLRAACSQKKMIFPEDERKKITSDFKLRIAYGELLFGQEKFANAREYFIKITNNKKASDYDKAIALIGAGYCDSLSLRTTDRKILLAKQEETWRKAMQLAKGTLLERHIMWMSASTLMQSTTTQKDALPIYKEYLKRYPKDEKKNSAWFMIALIHLGDQNDEASQIYRRLRSENPDSYHVKELERMFKFMEVDPMTGKKTKQTTK